MNLKLLRRSLQLLRHEGTRVDRTVCALKGAVIWKYVMDFPLNADVQILTKAYITLRFITDNFRSSSKPL